MKRTSFIVAIASIGALTYSQWPRSQPAEPGMERERDRSFSSVTTAAFPADLNTTPLHLASYSADELEEHHGMEPSPVLPAAPPADVADAARYWQGKQTENTPLEPLLAAYRRWAAQEGEAALEHALLTLQGDGRLEAARAALEVWAAQDMQAAAAHLASLLTPDHDFLIFTLARLYTDVAPVDALNWSMHQVPAEYQNGATQHAMIQWLSHDPVAAVTWASQQVRTAPLTHRPEQTAVAEAWTVLAQNDLETARTWVEALPPGPAREVTGQAVVDTWASQDPAAAQAWLASQPGLDQARSTLAQYLAHQDPAAAQAMLATITDDLVREDATFFVSRITGER